LLYSALKKKKRASVDEKRTESPKIRIKGVEEFKNHAFLLY